MKKLLFLCCICIILFTGCAPTRESEMEKLGEYWHSLFYDYKSELHAEYYGNTVDKSDTNKTVLIKLISGELADIFESNYFEIDREFSYKEVNLNTMVYKNVYSYWYDNDDGTKRNSIGMYEYNYLTNISKGVYREVFFNKKGEEIEKKAYTQNILYNFNSGISECSETTGYNNVKQCKYSTTTNGKLLMDMQEEFIEKIRLSGVDENLLK